MILLNNLFQINNYQESDAAFCYTINLNPNHLIYKAHFPKHPITPGVCILQIANELLELKLQRKLFLSKGNNIKYLAILSPLENSVVSFEYSKLVLNENECKVHIEVKNKHCIFAKLSLTFVYDYI